MLGRSLRMKKKMRVLHLGLHANNKGADQTAHPCSLISTFDVQFLKSINAKLASCTWEKVQNFQNPELSRLLS